MIREKLNKSIFHGLFYVLANFAKNWPWLFKYASKNFVSTSDAIVFCLVSHLEKYLGARNTPRKARQNVQKYLKNRFFVFFSNQGVFPAKAIGGILVIFR